jgi:SAM-dependent methyltransferase
MSSFGMPVSYHARLEPSYFDDEDTGTLWQPDVYETARRIAERTGRTSVIDVGCGSGMKLEVLRGRDLVIIDMEGPNLVAARERFPTARAIPFDLGHADDLPIDRADLESALVICSDVIEHIPDPSALLRFLSGAVASGAIVVLSTPERRVTWGSEHAGPPPNQAHCREWALPELRDLLAEFGMADTAVSLTRSNDEHALLATIVAAIFPDDVVAAACGDLVLPTMDAVADALVELRDSERSVMAANAAHVADLDALQRQYDSSTTWHEQHQREAEAWYAGKLEAAEEQIAELELRWTAEVDRRDRQIAELKASIADLTRRADGAGGSTPSRPR